MANKFNPQRRLSASTVASSRPRRIQATSRLVATQNNRVGKQIATKSTPKKRGPRAGSKVTVVSSDGTGTLKNKKKKRGKQSEATKARKRRESTKLKRKSLKTEDDSEDDLEIPKGAPKPQKIFNDELKSEVLEYEVEAVRDSKMGKGTRWYLVKWMGWEEKANTWEPEVNLRNALEKIAAFDRQFLDKV